MMLAKGAGERGMVRRVVAAKAVRAKPPTRVRSVEMFMPRGKHDMGKTYKAPIGSIGSIAKNDVF
jgi:hypothetical protein